MQHLEGGLIREIRVSDGDPVRAGDVLMVLADIGAQSEVGHSLSRLRALAATEARLEAERRGSDTVAFDHAALKDRGQPDVREVIEQQINQLMTRRANDASQESILSQRIAQLQQQIAGAEKQLQSVRRQNALIREEIVVVKDMYEKGYERKSRLLALQRSEADLAGQEGELLSRIATANEHIGETKLQIVNIAVKTSTSSFRRRMPAASRWNNKSDRASIAWRERRRSARRNRDVSRAYHLRCGHARLERPVGPNRREKIGVSGWSGRCRAELHLRLSCRRRSEVLQRLRTGRAVLLRRAGTALQSVNRGFGIKKERRWPQGIDDVARMSDV